MVQEIDRDKLFNDGATDVAGACAFTSLSRSTVYALMDTGRLPYTKVGTRRLIPRKSLVELLTQELAGKGMAERAKGGRADG